MGPLQYRCIYFVLKANVTFRVGVPVRIDESRRQSRSRISPLHPLSQWCERDAERGEKVTDFVASPTICGATTSLSPFAVLVVNGGRTVPLKFNVFVDGVEQTTTDGLAMRVQPISCDSSAPLDAVEPAVVSGGAGPRYDAAAGHFVQNWKVPTTPAATWSA